jgi:hypothetical protein
MIGCEWVVPSFEFARFLLYDGLPVRRPPASSALRSGDRIQPKSSALRGEKDDETNSLDLLIDMR